MPRVGGEDGGEDAHRRRLPRAIGPQQAEDGAFLHGEAHAVEGAHLAAECLSQIVGLDGGGHGESSRLRAGVTNRAYGSPGPRPDQASEHGARTSDLGTDFTFRAYGPGDTSATTARLGGTAAGRLEDFEGHERVGGVDGRRSTPSRTARPTPS